MTFAPRTESVRLAGPQELRRGDTFLTLGEVTYVEAPTAPREWYKVGLRRWDGCDAVLNWPARQSIRVSRPCGAGA